MSSLEHVGIIEETLPEPAVDPDNFDSAPAPQPPSPVVVAPPVEEKSKEPQPTPDSTRPEAKKSQQRRGAMTMSVRLAARLKHVRENLLTCCDGKKEISTKEVNVMYIYCPAC